MGEEEAMSRSQEFTDGYRMTHRPPPTGPGMHAAHEVYPDIHEHPEYYLSRHETSDRKVADETMRALRSTRGRPDAEVPMYRAAPKHVTEIHPGDWVTPSRSYAQQHAAGEGNFHVIKQTAKARHLLPSGDHPPEFGYQP